MRAMLLVCLVLRLRKEIGWIYTLGFGMQFRDMYYLALVQELRSAMILRMAISCIVLLLQKQVLRLNTSSAYFIMDSLACFQKWLL